MNNKYMLIPNQVPDNGMVKVKANPVVVREVEDTRGRSYALLCQGDRLHRIL